MPKFYIDEYTRELKGKHVCIACREGILRDTFSDILADIKFLNRLQIRTTFFHNLPNRFANQKHFRHLSDHLPETRIMRVPPDQDFYRHVLDYEDRMHKIIFLERKFLIDRRGFKINALNTRSARKDFIAGGGLIGNVNFRKTLEQICLKIEAGTCDRVHILPAGKQTIKHELFTIEGSGTLIANNFTEAFAPLKTDQELSIIHDILEMYRKQGYLKPRSKDYLDRQRSNFFVTRIDGIVVGCVEKKEIDAQTAEMGALVISTRFRNQRVGVFTVNAFIAEMVSQGYSRVISLTNNPRLQKLYHRLGFAPEDSDRYHERQMQSENVALFYLEI